MDLSQEVLSAESRIRPHIRQTYLEFSPSLRRHGAQEYCKLEILQHTGSFKVRGALNKVLSLDETQRTRGVVAASTGNHGAAVAFSAHRVGARCIIFVPAATARGKLRLCERLGAEIRFAGDDCLQTEVIARSYAAENDLVYISPYNDPQVIGGQGTIAVELVRQLDRIDVVLAALGGGGMISGIATHLDAVCPGAEIIGCSPANSQVMIESVAAGAIVAAPSLPTLSDSTAGGIEPGAITFACCQRLVDRYVTVSEQEIAASLRSFVTEHHMLIEGAAAVALASLEKLRERWVGKNVVVIICGANITGDTLRELL